MLCARWLMNACLDGLVPLFLCNGVAASNRLVNNAQWCACCEYSYPLFDAVYIQVIYPDCFCGDRCNVVIHVMCSWVWVIWLWKWTGMEECEQWRRKEQLSETEEQIEKSHRQGQEGISWVHMWRDHGISKNRTLLFNVHEDQGTRVEKNHGIQNTGV